MNLPQRKPTRLKGYDYGAPGYYFITVCTQDRKPLLSRIVGQGLAPAENILTDYGRIVEEELLALERRYESIKLDKYVIMPNHIHAIIVLTPPAAGASPCPTLSDVVCTFKSLAGHRCHRKLFQTSFHDHIVRGEQDYLKIWSYIDSNPQKWESDCFFV